jgi:hypothetical protein
MPADAISAVDRQLTPSDCSPRHAVTKENDGVVSKKRPLF